MATIPSLSLAQGKIKHVIVLMLENRSFDHMLGFSGIAGRLATDLTKQVTIEGINPANPPSNLDSRGNTMPCLPNAPFSIEDTDPGHEFEDVLYQLTGTDTVTLNSGAYPSPLTNAGFVQNYEDQKKVPMDHSMGMRCFGPQNLPVLTALAQEFVVCDNWFSSIPGPTWPNRFFIHAASSAGLDHSPTTGEILGADLIKKDGYEFANGTIYDLLNKQGIDWSIYAGNSFPQVLALKGIRGSDIKDYDDFAKDLSQPNFSAYTFIEPNYGHFMLGNYKGGTSQHPLDDVTHGEKLIKDTYESIRNSPLWNESLFIVTYDEHGGFYDHVLPPSNAIDPGPDKEYSTKGFNFQQYGVRVPAILISPLMEKNLIDKRLYDHTSLLATVEALFNLPNLTERDKAANTFFDLVTLDVPRDTPATLPVPAITNTPDIAADSLSEINVAKALGVGGEMDTSLVGFLHIAALRDAELSAGEPQDTVNTFSQIQTRQDALLYMHNVNQKITTATS